MFFYGDLNIINRMYLKKSYNYMENMQSQAFKNT